MQAERREEEVWAAKLVEHCRMVDAGPRPIVRPRALIVVDERGRVTIRRRSASGEWTVERFASVADAQDRQRQLMGS